MMRVSTLVIGGVCCLCLCVSHRLKAQLSQDSLWHQIEEVRQTQPDSAIALLQNNYTTFLEGGDTINAIKTLTRLATIYGNLAQYKDSYDQYWKALSFADKVHLKQQKAFIYRKIGMYYSLYNRREKALEFLNHALQLNQVLVAEGVIDAASLTHNYLAISSCYRRTGGFDMAQTYLDSSFLYLNEGIGGLALPFLETEQAFILCKKEAYSRAIQLLEKNIPWIQETLPAFLVIPYSFLGDAYKGAGLLEESERYYKNSLAISKEYNSHLDFLVRVHRNLSDLYAKKGNYASAFEQLKISRQLEKNYFDSRSINNRPFLEIQDKFRQELASKAQFLKEQRLKQLEYENRVNVLQKTLVIILLISIVVSSLIYFYHLRKRHRLEQQSAEKERAFELQKNKELLDVKNKELTTFTLKLIEKDEVLQELKEKVSDKKNQVSLSAIKRAIEKIAIDNTENWEEFEAKFVAVNTDFYENLKAHFPKLTRNDRKLCALIRLNLSSKEIARLMGISVESVHTTRYRLRKKLGLEKGVDLVDFMEGF